jgi:hypothetical protein
MAMRRFSAFNDEAKLLPAGARLANQLPLSNLDHDAIGLNRIMI